ncbi:MAG TPA: NAD(P)H-binding protein, partial [Candidatus Obscuribacterales bacterium]
LGSALLKRLQKQRFPVRVVTRGSGDWRNSPVIKLKQMGIDVLVGDIVNPEILKRAVVDCTAIINVAGTMAFSRKDDTNAVNIEAVKVLAEEAQARGIQRFIHTSCLGASANSSCEYFRQKAAADEIIKSCRFYWTIFRPSYMFGESFPFLQLLMPVVKIKPVIPVVGSGLNRIQPVCVDDVADAILQSIYNRNTVGHVYELGGPKVFSLIEFIELVKAHKGIKTQLVHVPTDRAEATVKLIGKVMSGVSADFVQLLTQDSMVQNQPPHEAFQLERRSLEHSLELLLARL